MKPESEHLTVTRVDLDREECRLGLRFPGPTEARAFAEAVSALLEQDLSLEIHPNAGGPPVNGDRSEPDLPGRGSNGGGTNGGGPAAGHRSGPPETPEPDVPGPGRNRGSNGHGSNGHGSNGRGGQATDDTGATLSEVEVLARSLRHDLKNPLAAVTTSLQMLREAGDLTDETESYLDEAMVGVSRVEDILEAVGTYGALGGGDAAPVDLDDALDDALENLGEAADGADIERDPLPTVVGLRGDLVRLFQNLVGNALRYAGDQARVRVTVTRVGDRWCLRVSDDGPGIPEDEQDGIFEPFRRGGSAAGTEGSGLGLALCRRVAESHGGTIDVLSAPGQGATFQVDLPATETLPT